MYCPYTMWFFLSASSRLISTTTFDVPHTDAALVTTDGSPRRLFVWPTRKFTCRLALYVLTDLLTLKNFDVHMKVIFKSLYLVTGVDFVQKDDGKSCAT